METLNFEDHTTVIPSVITVMYFPETQDNEYTGLDKGEDVTDHCHFGFEVWGQRMDEDVEGKIGQGKSLGQARRWQDIQGTRRLTQLAQDLSQSCHDARSEVSKHGVETKKVFEVMIVVEEERAWLVWQGYYHGDDDT